MSLPVPVPWHSRSGHNPPARPNIRAMKVTVDPVACEANAIGARLVPQVFSIHEDEEGEDVLPIPGGGEVPAEHADGVRDAVSRCPKMALTLDGSPLRVTAVDHEAERDREDDQDAADDVLPVVGDGEQVEPVRDHAEHQHAEYGAPHRADSAEDAGAAEGDAGDREQRELPGQPFLRARPRSRHRRVDQAGQAAGGTGDDEGGDHRPVDLQAGQPRRVAVVADAVEVPSEDRIRQHELQDDGEHDEDDGGIPDAAGLVLPDERERAARRRDQQAAVGHADRDAAEREAARERGEERVDPQLRHQQPVNQTHDRPGADRDGEAPRNAPVDRGPRAEHLAQREDRPERQVEVARDDGERHRARRDADRRVLVDDVEQVGRGQEAGRGDGEVDEQRGGEDDDAVVADMLRRDPEPQARDGDPADADGGAWGARFPGWRVPRLRNRCQGIGRRWVSWRAHAIVLPPRPKAASITASIGGSALNSRVTEPRRITSTRWASPSTSSISDEISSTAVPSAASLLIRRWIAARAATSTPRVGSWG